MFRRKPSPERDSYQAYLGDVIGDPPILQSTYRARYVGPRWIENGVHLVLAWLAAGIFTVLIVIYVVLMFAFFSAQTALAADTYSVPDTCKALASKYGVADTLTREEAERAVEQLDRHTWWPGVRQCRREINRKWKM